ncbi:MAG: hypothetical protein MJZ74_06780 [Muribaculaceae bacterium]|nr:hypothetical protein [Muribaculaceae bacterium]
MYNKISLLIIVLFTALVAGAQNDVEMKKNEVSLSAGSLLGVMNWGLTGSDYDRFSPSVSLGYMRRLSPVWSVGATITYVHENEQKECMAIDFETGDVGLYNKHDKYDYCNVMATAKASWARHKTWNFYSRVGVGPSLVNRQDLYNDRKKVECVVNYQLTPVAFEVGNDKVRGFAELGFGLQGILNVGISHRF